MLNIKNLTVNIEDHVLLEDINLEIKSGEIHAVMGPKNAGKSHLALAILGNKNIEYSKGSVNYKKKKLSSNQLTERAKMGIYVSFQHLPTITGITNFELLKASLKSCNYAISNNFEKSYKDLCNALGLSSEHGNKIVNDEMMSVAECKKNEIIQIIFLNPNLIVLDEIEEYLSQDELILIANFLKTFLSKKSKSALIITHSHTLLDILKPSHVHVMVNGAIREQGTNELYKRIVKDGYSQFS